MPTATCTTSRWSPWASPLPPASWWRSCRPGNEQGAGGRRPRERRCRGPTPAIPAGAGRAEILRAVVGTCSSGRRGSGSPGGYGAAVGGRGLRPHAAACPGDDPGSHSGLDRAVGAAGLAGFHLAGVCRLGLAGFIALQLLMLGIVAAYCRKLSASLRFPATRRQLDALKEQIHGTQDTSETDSATG